MNEGQSRREFREPICATCGHDIPHHSNVGKPFVLNKGEGSYFWFDDDGFIGRHPNPLDGRDVPYCAKCVEVFDALLALRA